MKPTHKTSEGQPLRMLQVAHLINGDDLEKAATECIMRAGDQEAAAADSLQVQLPPRITRAMIHQRLRLMLEQGGSDMMEMWESYNLPDRATEYEQGKQLARTLYPTFYQ